ncbi:MAG: zf-HC2 domain-containing protein [Deltaproteobacteria bacterium]|nr:zf-HC2 domain-containing protein [Deltaproteobacteria bacterium]
MSEHDHVERLVDRYFAGKLAPGRVDEMRRHLRECDACRARYDRLALAEQRAVGQAEARALADLRLLEDVVGASQLARRPEPARRRWLAYALAPTVAVAATFALVILNQTPSGDERLVARGPGATGAAVGVGVAAVDPARGLVYDARRPEGIALDHRLRFSYSNSAGEARYLFLFGLDEELMPYWYFPLPEEKTSLAIERGPAARQLPLPYETELARRHRAGRLRVVALFSVDPIALTAVEEALAAARSERRPLDRIAWPGQPTVQIVELSLVPGAGG